jgi:hypothetical protein
MCIQEIFKVKPQSHSMDMWISRIRFTHYSPIVSKFCVTPRAKFIINICQRFIQTTTDVTVSNGGFISHKWVALRKTSYVVKSVVVSKLAARCGNSDEVLVSRIISYCGYRVFLAQIMMMMMMIITIIIIDKAHWCAHLPQSVERSRVGKLTTLWQPQLKTDRNILIHNRW